MVVSSGNYDILENGNALTFDENSNIVIEIKASINFKFCIVLEFREEDGERRLEREIDEKKGIIKYTCINFREGAGTAEALEIGHVGGKKIYFHFWVEKVSDSTYIRNILYTVYKEK